MALLPQEWLQPATISRIHLHWTAGSHTASSNDKDHYHILINGDGRVVKGNCDISANSSTRPRTGKVAWHTLNANTGAIGVSMCCMADAEERPFNPGKYPLTKVQWEVAAEVVAELCLRYKVAVTPRTVLSHAEVQPNLGIKQRGKWDVAVLPFDTSFDTARECGDQFRKMVQEHLNAIGTGSERQPRKMVVRSPVSPLNVRGGPGTGFEVLLEGKLTLADGSPVDELEVRGSWSRVRFGSEGDEGWVFNSYLRPAQ